MCIDVRPRAAFLLLPLLLAQCGEAQQPSTKPSATMEQPAPAATDSTPPQEVEKLSSSDLARVCRAAIAALNDHDPSIIEVSSNTGDIVQVRYPRPSDGKVWTNECRVVGGRVVWRTVNAFGPGSSKGRWRTAPMDEVLTYKIDGPDVSITTTYSGAPSSTETYRIGD
jgi:hypothetical protein